MDCRDAEVRGRSYSLKALITVYGCTLSGVETTGYKALLSGNVHNVSRYGPS